MSQPEQARCESAPVFERTQGIQQAMVPTIVSDREELRAVALSYLIGALLTRDETGNIEPQVELNDALVFGEGSEESLPEHIYDVDRVLAKTPLLRKDNAFHDTLNGSDTISCPYVLNKPGREGSGGLEAVVQFGKATAGHPNIVHGGITALTFDNLLGWALFLQGTGAVFTASLKVDYKAPLPCLTIALVEVRIDRVEGRKLFVTARLTSLERDTLYALAEALFIKPRPKPEGEQV